MGATDPAGTREPQSGRGRDRCRLLSPKPALFSLQTDRWRHTRAISGLRQKAPEIQNRAGSANTSRGDLFRLGLASTLFEPPQKSPKNRSEQVPPRRRVGTNLANSHKYAAGR